MSRRHLRWMLLVAVVPLLACLAHGYEYDRHILKGIGPVVVDVLDPESDRPELTAEAIRRRVAERLRQNAIPVLEEDPASGDAVPHLRVRARVARIDQHHYAFTVHVGLLDAAGLVRDPSIVGYVETWESTDTLAYALTRNLTGQLDAAIDEKIDQFVSDYLMVNPD